MCCIGAVGKTLQPPKWIKPQLTRVADEAPAGDDWLHEMKYDGYRMHARLDGGKIQLLTRTGLDWSRRYQRSIEALRCLPVKTAYLDGELCALRPVQARRPGRSVPGHTPVETHRSLRRSAGCSRRRVPRAMARTTIAWHRSPPVEPERVAET